MPQNVLEVYLDQLLSLEAEELLQRILASDMPHTTKAERRRVFRHLTRLAEIDEGDAPTKVDPTTEGGRQVAAGLGIGLVIEPSSEPPSPPAEDSEDSEDDAVESSEETTD